MSAYKIETINNKIFLFSEMRDAYHSEEIEISIPLENFRDSMPYLVKEIENISKSEITKIIQIVDKLEFEEAYNEIDKKSLTELLKHSNTKN